MKRGKRYQECEKLVDSTKVYTAKEALDVIQTMPKAKFDETLELHVEIELSQDFFTGRDVKQIKVGDKFKLTNNAHTYAYTATAPDSDVMYLEVTGVREAYHPITMLADMSNFPVAHKMISVEVKFA